MVDTHFQFGVGNNDLKAPSTISVGINPTRFPHEIPRIRQNSGENDKGPSYQLMDNLDNFSRFILFVAELLGTAMLVFIGCTGCSQNASHGEVALTFGLAIMIAVQCFAHISGAHINPIVTVAAAVLGRMPLYQVPIYIIAQFIGAFLGFGLLKAIGGESGVCSPTFDIPVTPGQKLLVEFMISFILIMIVCSAWDKKNSDKEDSVTIKFGLTVTGLALAAGPYSGAHMNPVRSLAPAVFNGIWTDHWIYWVGPLLAGVTGSLMYKFFFDKKRDEQVDNARFNISVS